tara:strand:- start:259 stop:1038 length:780 start_codon:yes stop_codon:yes gene_type:complete
MEKNLKVLKKLKKAKKNNKVLVLGHNALDYKSVLKYPFGYDTNRGFHPPAPTGLLFDNWQDFDGDIITCHFQNYNSTFVVASEHSPRFHASKGIKVSNVPAYNRLSPEALKGMIDSGLNPDDFNFIDIPKVFGHKNNTIVLYSGFLALILACMLEYKEIFTAGIDGTILGYEGGFVNKKKHIKALKQYVRKGYHKKVGIYQNKKPKNIAEWSDNKVYDNYEERLKYLIDYCNDKYPNSKIYKSHKLSKLPVQIKNPIRV